MYDENTSKLWMVLKQLQKDLVKQKEVIDLKKRFFFLFVAFQSHSLRLQLFFYFLLR